MTTLEEFLKICKAYCRVKKIKLATLSYYILQDQSALGRMEAGTRTITLDKLEESKRWLSKNWPDGKAIWPYGIPRPDPDVKK